MLVDGDAEAHGDKLGRPCGASERLHLVAEHLVAAPPSGCTSGLVPETGKREVIGGGARGPSRGCLVVLGVALLVAFACEATVWRWSAGTPAADEPADPAGAGGERAPRQGTSLAMLDEVRSEAQRAALLQTAKVTAAVRHLERLGEAAARQAQDSVAATPYVAGVPLPWAPRSGAAREALIPGSPALRPGRQALPGTGTPAETPAGGAAEPPAVRGAGVRLVAELYTFGAPAASKELMHDASRESGCFADVLVRLLGNSMQIERHADRPRRGTERIGHVCE